MCIQRRRSERCVPSVIENEHFTPEGNFMSVYMDLQQNEDAQDEMKVLTSPGYSIPGAIDGPSWLLVLAKWLPRLIQ